jgi:Cu+-exporting ATPase
MPEFNSIAVRPDQRLLAEDCYHCGESCQDEHIHLEEKVFCCEGCKMVYEILNTHDLCRYYDLDASAGVSLKGKSTTAFAFLDDAEVSDRLIDYRDASSTKVTLYLPQIHCASCIWLLENLYRLSPGIRQSTVNFPKKEIYITFENTGTSLRKVVELLASIGYEPAITLSDLDASERPMMNRTFYYQLGVAGFAFGNIMLLSFPEYLGLEQATDAFFHQVFGYINVLLGIPVAFYSGRDYFQAAWTGLKQKQLTIDLPLALGIAVLFGRSTWEILSHTGAGFMDSLAGLVFFLLLGKWFQQKTYHNISFERDYKSYFPIAASRLSGNQEKTVSLDKLEPGDVIVIRHQELIPADAVVLRGEASIDYSFVTGESAPVHCTSGEKVYAGGRQLGSAIQISLTRKVSQSYLTQLWNDEAFTKPSVSSTGTIANTIGKYFTMAILGIGVLTLAYWLPRDTTTAFNAFTAVLIVACPCAVALAIPFIFGNVLRIMAKHQFFLKNTAVVESMVKATAVVFDKTGTITQRQESEIWFQGDPLSYADKSLLRCLVAPSAHPGSSSILHWLDEQEPGLAMEALSPEHWAEFVGQGVEATIGTKTLRLGSAAFVGQQQEQSGIYFSINQQLRGYFQLSRRFRPGTEQVLPYFSAQAEIYLLSGDNDRERPLLLPLFGSDNRLWFNQQPQDKLNFVRQLQQSGHQVLMLGDGLNDAGALRQSNAGIVLAEDTNNFTPACDAILQASAFHRLPDYLGFMRRSIHLVYYAYALALVYNVIGMSYAVQGLLSPIIAAILMPASSITIVVFGMVSSNWLAKKHLTYP